MVTHCLSYYVEMKRTTIWDKCKFRLFVLRDDKVNTSITIGGHADYFNSRYVNINSEQHAAVGSNGLMVSNCIYQMSVRCSFS